MFHSAAALASPLTAPGAELDASELGNVQLCNNMSCFECITVGSVVYGETVHQCGEDDYVHTAGGTSWFEPAGHLNDMQLLDTITQQFYVMFCMHYAGKRCLLGNDTRLVFPP